MDIQLKDTDHNGDIRGCCNSTHNGTISNYVFKRTRIK